MDKWIELRKAIQELRQDNLDKPDVENATRYLLNIMKVLDDKYRHECERSVTMEMRDKEKVLTGLECLISDSVSCIGCPYNRCDTSCIKRITSDAKELIKKQPEIIRCKDCGKGAYIAAPGMLPFVTCNGVDHELDWFCADAERR